MRTMPVLETARLLIRPLTMDDLDTIHQILDVELEPESLHTAEFSLEQRRAWLQWSVLNYEQLARLYQPPYGDRGIVLRSTGELIGACGYVPCMDRYCQIPALLPGAPPAAGATCELGLFYAVSPRYQRLGYAAEAAQALIRYAFDEMHAARVIATTDYDNLASARVMQKCGMRVERNPQPDPPWLQLVGVIERGG